MIRSWAVYRAWSHPGWGVRRSGNMRATRVFLTKRAAIRTAVSWGKRDKVSVLLHGDRCGEPSVRLLYPSERTFNRWLRV